MEPVLRISGRGAITITLQGPASGLASALSHIIRQSYSGAGLTPAPIFFPAQHRSAHGSSDGMALTGAPHQLEGLLRDLAAYDAVSGDFLKKAKTLLDNFLRQDYKIECGGGVLNLANRTHIMGILNVTPDSFSDGGRFVDADRALAHAREMAAAGADIIDIGGESTRPGAQPLSEEEEQRRIIPLIERLSAELSIPLSVDTYKSAVAKKALKAGASIVNDISGLRFSPDMAKVVADHGASVVVMHIKGTPRDMQQDPVYADVVDEIMSYLEEGIELALKAGVDREKIMVDPGIGFGKTLDHNLSILNRLDEFRALGRPVVLGTSRKKFIGAVLGIPVPEERVDGTSATVALGIERGACVVRVHDVKTMAQVARMTDAILRRT